VCPAGKTTTINVDLAPSIVVERGWGGDAATHTPAAVAVTRGALVFALHPVENKIIVKNYTTTPSHAGDHAPDYMISTNDTWNYALDLTTPPMFVQNVSSKWSLAFPFDDSGQYPFAIDVEAREAKAWGNWRGSEITAPPPRSPVGASACGPPVKLRLVPFGSTNIRVSVFPYV
jgi:hypothetical protein